MKFLRLVALSHFVLSLFCISVNGDATSGISNVFDDISIDETGKIHAESPVSMPRQDSDISDDDNILTPTTTLPNADGNSKINSDPRVSLKQMRHRKGRRNKNNKYGRRGKGNHAKKHRSRKPSKEDFPTKNIEDQKQILRDTMRHMFGFDHMVTTPKMSSHSVGSSEDETVKDPEFDTSKDAEDLSNSAPDEDSPSQDLPDSMPEPPDFMLELYRTYSEDKSLMLLHSRSQGNTVRSFFPSTADPKLRYKDRGKPVTISPIGKTNQDRHDSGSDGFNEDLSHENPIPQIPVFIFNLSSIPSPESLVGTEIRLDGYRKRSQVPLPTRENVQSSDNGFDNLRNDNTEIHHTNGMGNEHSIDSSNQNNTSMPSWYLLVAVYRTPKNDCSGQPNCNTEASKIFSRVGKTHTISSPTITSWSARELVRIATKARKSGHLMVVKFQKSAGIDGETERHAEADQLLRRTRDINENEEMKSDFDLPEAFTVVDSERPKRNSDHKRNKLYASATPFHSTSSVPIDDKEREGGDWFDTDYNPAPVPLLIVYCNDSRTAVTSEIPSAAPIIWGALENMTGSIIRRNRRSAELEADDEMSDGVDDNLIPGEDGTSDSSDNMNDDAEATPPEMRKTFMVEKGKGRNIHGGKKEESLENDRTELNTSGKGNSRTHRKNPKSRNGGKHRKKNPRCNGKRSRGRKNCKKGRGNIKPHSSLLGLNRPNAACGRKSLHVDFADIGWSDWIISPKYFDAYYCTGRCELSEMKVTGTSNHAIIQAVIKSMGVNKDVPSPCCVPEKLMSLSVLFFDGDRNVVLKAYPNMSVETCACR